jgi:hypothetical protein
VNADELRPAYRTLNEPSRLFGLSISTVLSVAAAAAVGYGWLLISPLPWRANVSIAVIGLGAPLVLLVVRESAALSPARLLLAVIRWRVRPTRIEGVTPGSRVRGGAVRLDDPPAEIGDGPPAPEAELPWLEDDENERGAP